MDQKVGDLDRAATLDRLLGGEGKKVRAASALVAQTEKRADRQSIHSRSVRPNRPIEFSNRWTDLGGPVRLIMALTFTLTLGVVTADRIQVRTMLLAALGCNLAWG